MEGPGGLLDGRLGAGKTPQKKSCYLTKYRPDRFHLTPIREGFWLESWSLKKTQDLFKQPDVSHDHDDNDVDVSDDGDCIDDDDDDDDDDDASAWLMSGWDLRF